MLACPHCGKDLGENLKDGIGSCGHCERYFDTCPFNRLLSACWYVRRHNVEHVSDLPKDAMREEEALVACALAYYGEYSHDELIKIFRSWGISENYVSEDEV